jgi:hypothetical protein
MTTTNTSSLLDEIIKDAKTELLAYDLASNSSNVPLKVVSRLIRKALTKLYGRENVKVRTEDYGWIDIEVRIERPHEGECMKSDDYSRIFECERCRYVRDATRDEVWRIINRSGLVKHLYTYYNDMDEKREQCIVTVLFHDEP